MIRNLNNDKNNITFEFNQVKEILKNYLDQNDSSEKTSLKGKKMSTDSAKIIKPKTFFDENQFLIKPLELEKYLKKHIIGQDKAVSIIATKVATHYNRMFYEKKHGFKNLIGKVKNNILLIGPTGVGKTYIIKLIADKLGIPFVKGDATKYTETGYVGGDVEDLVRELYSISNEDKNLAEYGIIYIDEIDKIASRGDSGKQGIDISRSGVQRNLLKVMEESEVSLKSPMDMIFQMQNIMEIANKVSGKKDPSKKRINTRNILFIMSGAFNGLEDIVETRLNKKKIGFRTKAEKIKNNRKAEYKEEILKKVTHQDLIEYGFESEFVGRLPILAILNRLKKKDFYSILKNPNCNVILNKKRDFKVYGVDVSFSDDALKKIAQIAYTGKTGARNLSTIIEKYLIFFEKELPSSDILVKDLLVDLNLLRSPKQSLAQIQLKSILKDFSLSFFQENQIQLSFSDDALDYILTKNNLNRKDIDSFLNHRLKNYNHALKLIQKESFIVTKFVLENYSECLNNLTQKF